MNRAWWLGLVLLWACSGEVDPTTTTITVTTSASTTTEAESEFLRRIDSIGDLPVTVYAPPSVGPYPVVVLFHGGGWFGGAPLSTAPLAEFLASERIVVFNSTYRTQTGGYPESFADVACDVRYARANASNYTSAEGPVILAGHSAGAHLASVVALAGDEFGNGCPVEETAMVDRFLGLAGPYDPTLYRQVLPAFFGTRFVSRRQPGTRDPAHARRSRRVGTDQLDPAIRRCPGRSRVPRRDGRGGKGASSGPAGPQCRWRRRRQIRESVRSERAQRLPGAKGGSMTKQ